MDQVEELPQLKKEIEDWLKEKKQRVSEEIAKKVKNSGGIKEGKQMEEYVEDSQKKKEENFSVLKNID